MKSCTKKERFRSSFCKRIWLFLPAIFLFSCKKLVNVDPPITSLNGSNVFTNDETAMATLTGVYTLMMNSDFADGNGLSLYLGLSADEFKLHFQSNTSNYNKFYLNALTTEQNVTFWEKLYRFIYYCNAAIEGLSSSNALSPSVKQQLLGEAKFVRAFCYFYLTNLHKDVPLLTTTNYQTNAIANRNKQIAVYQQIISDLKDARGILPEYYVAIDGKTETEERLRPNKWAAAAMLARVYLYTSDYSDAEIQSTEVINYKTLYDTVALNEVFLKNSKEAIWQLQPTLAGQNTRDAMIFILPTTGPSVSGPGYPVSLFETLLNSFESKDLRKPNWIGSVTVGPTTYYYPFKYKSSSPGSPLTEYQMALRLGEQYLIRAEARAYLGKIEEANADLNIIRHRAGLPNVSISSKEDLLRTILHERQIELFTEWGHRWLDLKRSAKINEIMASVTPLKGGSWNSNWQWYPIPQYDIDRNPNLLPNNNGY